MTILFVLIALAAGAANPLQSGTNAQLNKQLGAPVWAAISVYVTGLLGVLIVQLFLRQPVPGVARGDGGEAVGVAGRSGEYCVDCGGPDAGAEDGIGCVYRADADGIAGDVGAAGSVWVGWVCAEVSVADADGGVRVDDCGCVDDRAGVSGRGHC